jgi:hypothetical protein
MALPDHIKRQAMDAVSHRETIEMMRRYGVSDVTASELFQNRHAAPVQRGALPDEVKRQAMDAVGSREIVAQIRLVKDGGHVFPPTTPRTETNRIAGKISQMHKTGHHPQRIQREMSKDDFGRDYGA